MGPESLVTIVKHNGLAEFGNSHRVSYYIQVANWRNNHA
jgi:hypothetical protein